MIDIAIRIENLSKLYPSTRHFDFTQDIAQDKPFDRVHTEPVEVLRTSPSTGSGQASGTTGRVNSKFAIRNPKFVLTGRESICLNGAILGQ